MGNEPFWMIEDANRRWFKGCCDEPNAGCFVIDANDALHFSRQEDAQRIMLRFFPDRYNLLRVTDHLYLDDRRARAARTERKEGE